MDLASNLGRTQPRGADLFAYCPARKKSYVDLGLESAGSMQNRIHIADLEIFIELHDQYVRNESAILVGKSKNRMFSGRTQKRRRGNLLQQDYHVLHSVCWADYQALVWHVLANVLILGDL